MSHPGLDKFKEEMDLITNDDIKAFVNNAIVTGPESFWQNDTTVKIAKKAVAIVDLFMQNDNLANGVIRDMILAGTILSDIALNELSDKVKILHPFAASIYLNPLKKDIHGNSYQGALRIIETHEGNQTPSVIVRVQPGTPEYLVAQAYTLAKSDVITINKTLKEEKQKNE
jgi:hypothetical protein